MTKNELNTYRRKLEAMATRLSTEESDLRHEVLHAGKDGENIRVADQQSTLDDLGREKSEEEVALSLLGNEEELLADCQAALDRIKASTFGACEACRKPIAKDRLKAAPYVRLCIDCARREPK
jgi:DnaK suppressor protein